MVSLMLSVLSSIALIQEAPAYAALVGSVCVTALLLTSRENDQPRIALSRHTQADIGIEPGSITWLR